MRPWIRPTSYPRKLLWSWRLVGLRATVLVVLAKPVDRLFHGLLPGLWYQHLTERQFDQRFDVDTHQFIQLNEYEDLTAAQRAEMMEYGPTRTMDFGPLVAALDIDLAQYTFLDIGSGKGKALLLAAQFPFRAVIGVELSPALHRAAVANLARYRGPRQSTDVRALEGDALMMPFPEGPFVCFMFNPFPASVVQRFLDRLRADVQAAPRHVLIAFGNPFDDQLDVLRSHPSLHAVDGDVDGHVLYEFNTGLRHLPHRPAGRRRSAGVPADRTPAQVSVLRFSDLTPEDIGRWIDWHGRTPLAGSPFVHPDFAAAAADVIDATRVAVIHHRGEPVGYLPFELHGRSARPIGNGTSDGDGIVLRPGINVKLLPLLRAAGLTSVHYMHIPVRRSPFEPFHNHTVPAARIALDEEGWDGYVRQLRARGSKVLAQTRRKRRQLERDVGAVRVVIDDDHDVHADTLLRWKTQMVADRGGDARFDGSPAADLIKQLGRRTPRDERFRSLMTTLWAGDRLVALCWSPCAGPLVVLSIPAHDATFDSYSPGLLLHVEFIAAMAEDGTTREIDLGFGINQTKARLMTHTEDYAQGSAYTSPAMRVYRRARTSARKRIKGA